MFASSPIPVLEQWLNFAQSRHEVLASNVANIDMPGYRTRDLSVEQFQIEAARTPMAKRDANRTTGSESLGARSTSIRSPKCGGDMNNILYHDEATSASNNKSPRSRRTICNTTWR